MRSLDLRRYGRTSSWVNLTVQYALIHTLKTDLPPLSLIRKWIETTVKQVFDQKNISHLNRQSVLDITVRIVEESEIANLNRRYRHNTGPTNVLSFNYSPEIYFPVHGDVVICASVVLKEAVNQKKYPEAHWAHLIIHGVLHLFGYDHINSEEAEIMESLELCILRLLGYPNP